MNQQSNPDSEWIKVGTLQNIPVRGARCFKHNDVNYAVFRNSDDAIYVLKDSCPHKGGPLSQGIVHDGSVTCPLHNWVISLETGQAQGADKGKTPCYPSRIIDNEIQVQLADLHTATEQIA